MACVFLFWEMEMRSSVNRVFLGGVVVSEPVVHTLYGGAKVCTLVLRSGGALEPEYHRLVVPELISEPFLELSVGMGTGLYVVGRKATHKWVKPGSMVALSVCEVIAEEVQVEVGFASDVVGSVGELPGHPLDKVLADPVGVEDIPF